MYRLLLIFAVLLTGNVFAQTPAVRYSITGHLTGLKSRTIYLTSAGPLENPASSLVDSCVTSDGYFTFQGSLGEVKYVTLRIRGKSREQVKTFLLDNTPISIIGHADTLEQVSIAGSPYLRHQTILDKSLEQNVKRREKLEQLQGEAIQKGGHESQIRYSRQYQAVIQELIAIKYQFIELYSSSPVSLFALNDILPHIPKDKARNLWQGLDYSLQQHSVGRRIGSLIFDQTAEPRQSMPNLILADQLTKPVSLLAYKGNVVLLDFWASWCEPCHQEHHRLKSLYQQYKDKGLQIISISVDEDPKAWEAALRKANLPWPQLSDRIGSRNVVGTHYGNGSVPINWLIDKEGFVIRKGLHGTDLEKELAIVFSKP